MFQNPKILIFFITIGIFGISYFGLLLWHGGTWDLSWLTHKELTAASGDVLDKFSNQTDSTTVGDASALTRQLKKLSDEAAVSAVNGSQNGAAEFYQRSDGTVQEVLMAGYSARTISANKLPGFIRSIWAPNHQSVISLFATSGGSEYRYYNYASHQTAKLPANTRSVVFSPDSSQIAYFATNGDIGAIYLAFPDATNHKQLLETRIPELQLYWPAGDSIYFSSLNHNSNTWDLVRISESGTLENILTDQQGLEVLWSPDGQKILFSTYSQDAGLHLAYRALSSLTPVILLAQTQASHCTWGIDSSTLYCGVPEEIPSFKDLQAGTFLPEAIYKTTIAGSKLELIYKQKPGPQGIISLQNVFVSPLENYLFFLNNFDARLYGLLLQ